MTVHIMMDSTKGDEQGEEVPAQHCFWYIGFGCGRRVSQGLKGGRWTEGLHWEGLGISSCGGGEDEDVLAKSSS